jgi:hypothetical protein
MLKLNKLNSTRRAIEALDLSEQNARVLELEMEIDRIDAAVNEANGRVAGIRAKIAQIRSPDGAAVADALLGGATALEATAGAAGEDELRAELGTLWAAMRDLEGRRERLKQGIEDARASAFQAAALCTDVLVAEIESEMQRAAQTIVDAFASLSSLGGAVRGYALQQSAARRAVEGVSGMDRILPFQRAYETPAAIIELLEPLRTKGRALPAQVSKGVSRSF